MMNIEFNDERLKETTVKENTVFDGVILHVNKDDITLPNGKPATREVIRHVGAVGIVPILDDGRIIVERQFRYPLAQAIIEIPAGKLDSKSEDRLEAAKRELREETGYTADEWIDIGNYHPAAAYTDELITLYVAKGLHKGEQELDDDEFLDFYAVPLDELVDDIMAGNITDGKTQVAILKVAMMN